MFIHLHERLHENNNDVKPGEISVRVTGDFKVGIAGSIVQRNTKIDKEVSNLFRRIRDH